MGTGAARWKLMKAIVDSVQEAGGTVFGGYVRDSIIHDHYATEFYSKAEEKHRYSDASYMPELSKRLCLPKDIDCFMLSSKLDVFKDSLKEKNFDMLVLDVTGNNMYFGSVLKDIVHAKIKVTFAMSYILKAAIDTKPFEVYVDVLHSPHDGEPPFKHLDFDCNAIVLTPQNEYKLSGLIKIDTPFKRLVKMNQIIDKIIDNEASVSGDDVCYKRVNHMLDKRWKIVGKHCLAYRIDEENDDVCTICLEQFKKFDCIVVNRCCQGSKMHRMCSEKLVKGFHKCTICRKDIAYTEADKKIMGVAKPEWKPLGLTNAR